MVTFLYVVVTLLVKAEWTNQIGGTGGSLQTLNCSDSWIDYIEGGISNGWSYDYDCVTNFRAECRNGESLETKCGYHVAAQVTNFSNDNGMDSVNVTTHPSAAFITGLSFFNSGDLVGSFIADSNVPSQNLQCPENQIITGIAVRCGAIMDAIMLYCGSPEMPTTTPTAIPSVQPTEIPTEAPTDIPTGVPTSFPTEMPTTKPTESPSVDPTEIPTEAPTDIPTGMPTSFPTEFPNVDPTEIPTEAPTDIPTGMPTLYPTQMPTFRQTVLPKPIPTATIDNCTEIIEKLENVIDYLMDYLFCMKHEPNPEDCNGSYYELKKMD